MSLRKRTKSNIGLGRRAWLRLALAAASAFGASGHAVAAADDYAIIGGTVFRPSGHAFPDVPVEIRAAAEPGGTGAKVKPLRARTGMRGEFAVRVPARRQRYTVVVAAEGFRREEKTVEIQADERVELSFLLETGK